jgi:hypothetical protein
LSRGKQPRSPAKAPKWELSGKGCENAETTRRFAYNGLVMLNLKILSKLELGELQGRLSYLNLEQSILCILNYGQPKVGKKGLNIIYI